MKSKRRFFIELLLTTINISGFLGRTIPNSVFISYLKLIKEYQKLILSLEDKHHGTTRANFEKTYSISQQENEIRNKVQSFKNRAEQVAPINTYDFYPNDALQKKYKDLYSYHRSKTGHIEGKPLTINRYREEDLIANDKKLKVIAKECVKVQLLEKIKDELEFSEVYTSADLKVVEGAADACWELYRSKNDITSTQLMQRVLSEYHIKRYDSFSPEETERKTKNAVNQWIRDVDKNKGIKILK